MLKKRRMKTFTLLELMVVIAVIGILLSFLIPVLSRAREAARDASCKSNLKQWGMGIAMYTGDHRSYLPASFNNSRQYWYAQLHSYMNYDASDVSDIYESGMIINTCPSVDHEKKNSGTLDYASNNEILKHTNFLADEFRLKITKVTAPSHSMTLADANGVFNGSTAAYPFIRGPIGVYLGGMWNFSANDYLTPYDDTEPELFIRFRHNENKNTNILVVDGHVEGKRMNQMQAKNIYNYD